MDVALVTYSGLPELAEDERLLADLLAASGVRVRSVAWDDPAIDWSSIDLCVLRSTWDYHHRLDEFLAWVVDVSRVTILWNPADVVLWNSRKTYLNDLAERGVRTVPTVWLERGAHANLGDIIALQRWDSAVIKPVVSASAYGTLLVTADTVEQGQTYLLKLLAERDMMVQPFMPSVETHGERSLMFIDGKFTHSVRRSPALGNDLYRHKRATLAIAPADAILFARRVLKVANVSTLYARVDLVRNETGALCLMELELVEPSLFLSEWPDAAHALADAITRRLPRRSPART